MADASGRGRKPYQVTYPVAAQVGCVYIKVEFNNTRGGKPRISAQAGRSNSVNLQSASLLLRNANPMERNLKPEAPNQSASLGLCHIYHRNSN
jgi:hypothetical protein